MKISDFGLNAYKKSDSIQNEQKSAENVALSVVKDMALKEGALLKVPRKDKSFDTNQSVYRRVAKFLMLIGTDEAAKIMPHLTSEQTEQIIKELATIQHVEEDEAAQIMQEFSSLLNRAREDGGVDTARNILEKAFGSEHAEQLLEKAVPFKNGRPFSYLSEADSEKISALLKDESAAVRALVLSYLKPKISAQVIQNLPDSEKKEVVLRLAKLKEMNPEVLKRVDVAMEEKMRNLVIKKTDSIDGRSVLANILKRMESGAEEKVIDQLSKTDPNLGADLRERLFTIEDILNADDRFVQEKLRTMEDVQIAFVIAGKSEEFRQKILSNISSNRKQLILDEEERHKPMLRADVEKETSLFFSFMRRAWEEGKLIINGRGDEIYV